MAVRRAPPVLIRRQLAAALLALAAIGQPEHLRMTRAAAPAVDPRFGLIEPHAAPARADEIGAAWGRARFHWGLIQPDGPDQWIEAEMTQPQLLAEQDAGREVIGLLIGVPEWARSPEGLPRGLTLPPDDPGNTWAVFVREAVTRYRGQIDHWIIWNEPDIWDASHPGFTWPGDEGDYIQLLRTAYLVAHEANPEVVIHLAALSHWWDVLYGRELYFRRLLDQLTAEPDAAANDYFYDAATLHLYFEPASVYDVLVQYQAIQAEHGIDKPFWLIETNAPPSSDPARPVTEPTFRVSLLEQAAYMPQAVALGLAAGAERIGVYKLIDTPGDIAANPEPFGLVRADGTPRPAFRTTQVAFARLSGAERVRWTDRHLVAQVVVERPGEVVRMLWSRVPSPQLTRLPALADRAVVVDMWGNAHELTPQGGYYSVLLLAGECQQTTGDYCMIGGPPLYIVESVAELPGENDTPIEIMPGAAAEQAAAALGVSEGPPAVRLLTGGLSVIATVALAAAGILLRRRVVRDR